VRGIEPHHRKEWIARWVCAEACVAQTQMIVRVIGTLMLSYVPICRRPVDANEARTFQVILRLHNEPAVLVLSRQGVPTIDRTKYASASGLPRGVHSRRCHWWRP